MVGVHLASAFEHHWKAIEKRIARLSRSPTNWPCTNTCNPSSILLTATSLADIW